MKKVMSLFIGLLLITSTAFARSVTLQWDANTEPDLAGYKVYYNETGSTPPYTGTGATEGDSPVTVTFDMDENPDSDLVEFTLHNISDYKGVYFAATAYDDQGLESGYSNVVSIDNPPPAEPQNLITVLIVAIWNWFAGLFA